MIIILTVVAAIVFIVVMPLMASYKAYLGVNHDFTNKPIYTYSKWLGFEGNITQGYKVHLYTTYSTYTDDCRVVTGENHFAGFLMKPVLAYVVEGYDGKSAVTQDYIFGATLHPKGYSLRYPKSYMVDGCKFIFDKGTLVVKEETQSLWDAYKGEVLRYETVTYDEKERDTTLDAGFRCYRDKDSAKKDLVCERVDETYDSSYYYFMLRDYSEDNPFHVNIELLQETTKI